MAMHTPYAKPVTIAYPDVGLREPSISPWALGMARSILGAYLRLALGFERVELRGGDELARAFAGALSGERRLILAFRHPYGDEPQLLSWAFLRGVEREASRAGVRLPARPHAVFVHGYEVPRWGGALIRWLLPRVGAMPVHHSKMDSAGMARIRAAIEDGPYPLALSPEDGFILDSMGWVLFRLGDLNGALAYLERSYAKREDPEIAAHLGEVLWALGRQDDARRLLLEAQKRHPANEVLSGTIRRLSP